MRLAPKAIEYCHDQNQYNVMKFWALKDDELISERVNAITVMNPYLAFLCAQGSGEMAPVLEANIIEYIDKKLENRINSKRQFSSFLLVKLKMGLYEDCWRLMYDNGPRLIDEISIHEVINELMDTESGRVALVVFYVGVQKCKRELGHIVLDIMEDNDLFFVRTESNKKYFDTSIGYIVQNRDFRTLRLYFGNTNILKNLFDYLSDYTGIAHIPFATERDFMEMALNESSNAELFLVAEYITDILKIPNRLESRMIPDNSKAPEEDVKYVKELYEQYVPKTDGINLKV